MRRPLRPCLVHRCPRLVASGYCDVHRQLSPAARRPSPARRGLGAEHQAIAPQILERDRWICQLCMKPISRTAPPRTPFAPSIDHIVPVSRGGTGHPSNLRAAHYSCNSARGNREMPNAS